MFGSPDFTASSACSASRISLWWKHLRRGQVGALSAPQRLDTVDWRVHRGLRLLTCLAGHNSEFIPPPDNCVSLESHHTTYEVNS